MSEVKHNVRSAWEFPPQSLVVLASEYDALAAKVERLTAKLAQPAEAGGVDEFGLFCANCGKHLSRDGTLVTGPGIDHEEVCCSQFCHDEHERLGCPQGEPGGSFRDAEWYGRKLAALTAERDQLRADVEALRKDKERLAWMFDEECNVRGYLAQDGVRYGVVWPDLGESQADLFADPRAAIDAALAAKDDSA